MSKWTDETIERELRTITGALGSFPTVSELRGLDRDDLVNAVAKTLGFIGWSARLGLPRKASDSDTGWRGEVEVMRLFHQQGLTCVRTEGVKSPYDLLAEDVLRIDVKSAEFSSYGVSKGWFYRIGPQADLILLYQLDTEQFYAVPWWACPTSNVTITPTGKTYTNYLNNWTLIRQMIDVRQTERAAAS